MAEGFTNKEMLQRVLNKLDTIDVKLNNTYDMASRTNGKVKMHTKILWSLGGAGFAITVSLIGWLLKM